MNSLRKRGIIIFSILSLVIVACGGTAEEDCSGECNGDAVVDECGECGGDADADTEVGCGIDGDGGRDDVHSACTDDGDRDGGGHADCDAD